MDNYKICEKGINLDLSLSLQLVQYNLVFLDG